MQEVNVQVAVRVRPLLAKEKLTGETLCVRVIPGRNQIVMGRDRVFTFDQVFAATAVQADIYGRCIEPLVQSCFEGYNATVFAYGQTGSGKTYTIGGGSFFGQTSDSTGIVARAIQQIFRMIQNEANRKFTVKISYIEIYREELHDLMDLSLSKDLHIREDNHGNTMIVGATEVECDTADDVMLYLERGSAYRHTGSTQMNEKSSRSHAVFTVLIEQRWMSGVANPVEGSGKLDDVTVLSSDMNYKCAKFHFVDLAGSERAHRTGNVGQRFKESIHINSGLLALGNVISALGDTKRKTTHVPYRDSKITRLLKDSLGGNANTVMICCISPSSANLDESLNSLKYANRARNIKNKPVVNLDPQSTKIEVMESEIKSLREQLFRATTASTFVRDGETGEDSDLNDLRNELKRVNSLCGQFKALSEEAYVQLAELRDREFLSDSLNHRIYDWLELMEEMNDHVGSREQEADVNPTVRRLQKELEQCHRDLQNDAEIFLEKAEEANSAKEKAQQLEADNEELVRKLEEAEETINQLKGELLAKQMELDKVAEKMKEVHRSVDMGLSVMSHPSDPRTSRPGAKSAPLRTVAERETLKEAATRNIRTSPAAFTVDHLVKNFRARSQLLVSRLEDSDDVLSAKYDIEEDEEAPVVNVEGKGFERNTNSRRTYRVNQASSATSRSVDGPAPPKSKAENQQKKAVKPEIVGQRPTIDLSRRKLKQTEASLGQSTAKYRNLTINIRMKEQLIRQLVKNEKDAQEVNRIFLEKIQMLEKEKAVAKVELVNVQKEYEMKHLQDRAMNEQLQSEFRRRMEAAKAKLKSLKLQKRDTESMVSLMDNNKRIKQLQMSVNSLQKQQTELQQQLKLKTELQVKFEGDVKREQEELEMPVKREFLPPDLKDQMNGGPVSEDEARLEEQRMWLEVEMEKLLEQRRTTEELDKELRQREELLAKKEAMLVEKRELEMKILRTSQAQVKANHLDAGDFHLRLDDEMKKMRLERDRLHQERNSLNSKMQETSTVSSHDQRKLTELEEMVDALDAALDYKTEQISQKQTELRRSVQSLGTGNPALSKLRLLSLAEARSLLGRYFEKVIDLRDDQRKLTQQCKELEMAIEEERSLVAELEASLQHSAMETETKLLQQQQGYEMKLQLMMKNLTESEMSSRPKISELEKELFFYKTTCRTLRKQLREVTTASQTSASAAKPVTPIDGEAMDASRHVSHSRDTQVSHSRDSVAVTPRDVAGISRNTPQDAPTPSSHDAPRGPPRNGPQVSHPGEDNSAMGERPSTSLPRGHWPATTQRDTAKGSGGESGLDNGLLSGRSQPSARQVVTSLEKEKVAHHGKAISGSSDFNLPQKRHPKDHGGSTRKIPDDRVKVGPSLEVAGERYQSNDVSSQSAYQSHAVDSVAQRSGQIGRSDALRVDSRTPKDYESSRRQHSGIERKLMTSEQRGGIRDTMTNLHDSLEN